jgi:uncharacterized beta barrel domain-containing protein DUF5777
VCALAAGTVAAQEPPPGETDDFAPVARLLRSRCAMAGCHAGTDAAQGLRLETDRIYRSAVNVRARTDPKTLRVMPGSPDRSLLYLKLLPPDQGLYRGPRMPYAMDPLSEEEIALVRRWIDSFPADRWGPPPESEIPRAAPRTFQDSHLANLPTPDSLGAGTLEFRILHRFKPSATDAGSQGLYGLDGGAWISIGLAYAFTDGVEVGLRRTNFERDYEIHTKWLLLRQETGHSPLSFAVRGSYSNLRETGRSNRDRFGAQAILGRRFGRRVSAMLVPTYVTRTNYEDADDRRGTGAVGVGTEVRLGDKWAITAEWIGQTSGVKSPNQGASLGLSIATARHVFHLIASNTAASHTDLYAPGADLDLDREDFRLGFNISRSYTPR